MLISSSISAETVNFCSKERTDLSNEDGTGYYWDVLRAVYKTQQVEMIHSTAPFIRCLFLVENKVVDGAVAVFKTQKRSQKLTYPQSRLNYSSYGLTFLKQTPFDQIQNIKGNIGLIRGYDFSAWLPSHLDIYPVRNITQAIAMLKLKRLVYHADDLQDVLLTLKKTGERPDDFVLKTIYTKDLYIAFTKDARGQKMANIFDTGLKTIFKNGDLERLVKKYRLTNSVLDDFKKIDFR